MSLGVQALRNSKMEKPVQTSELEHNVRYRRALLGPNSLGLSGAPGSRFMTSSAGSVGRACNIGAGSRSLGLGRPARNSALWDRGQGRTWRTHDALLERGAEHHPVADQHMHVHPRARDRMPGP